MQLRHSPSTHPDDWDAGKKKEIAKVFGATDRPALAPRLPEKS